ncbi:hypothetical protein [Bacteroides fragilis]|uniref:hypothetical protein n=1 Tax=Bacteroides fragilis TaxID=817 RepID=UPI001CAA4295|nr:hypothetical protein [Bacteroides fragilis]MBY2895347.1 hypothetical protein [Bacteroides fragilis]MCE8633083.1 hypothetical protein [Bacteroides fragilis]MCE8682174.1 hypothetical protein [Bacteroides fragilis]MDA1474374.1 hypothetical protein [Bacteroides fragilis]UVS00332.1 hypothetical protein NXW55_01530 [Bacteroides fragilis]
MLNIFFEEGGKGKRGTHYYNIEGKEERKKERKKERRPGGQKGEKRDTDRRKKGKTKLSQGILLFSETPVRNQAKT